MRLAYLDLIRLITASDIITFRFGLFGVVKFKISMYLWLVKHLKLLIQEIRKGILSIS